jgi:AraC family transcriptional regulator
MILVEIKERAEFQVIGRFYSTAQTTLNPMEWWKSLIVSAKQKGYSYSQGSYSLQKYSLNYFQAFHPSNPFEYAPAIPVESGLPHPDECSILTVEGGLFAVFVHKGTAETFPQTMGAFFNEWLPQSEYSLDQRTHFCFMPPGYQTNHPLAEEEIWIPVCLKGEN